MDFFATFVPKESLFGVFPGGWLAVIIALVVCAAIAMFTARTGSTGWPLGATLMAVVFYNGFQWEIPQVWCTLFWVLWAAALLGWWANATSGASDFVWQLTCVAAIISLAASIGLASQRRFDIMTGSEGKAIAAELTKQADQAKQVIEAQTAKDKEQDARLTDLEKRVKALEEKDKQVEARLKGIEYIMGGLSYTSFSTNMTAEARNHALLSAGEQLAAAGWKPGQISLIIDWSQFVCETGTHPYAKCQVHSLADLVKYLNAGTPASQAVRDRLKAKLAVEPGLYEKVLAGENIMLIQFKEESCLTGNTFFLDGVVKENPSQTCHSAGDIIALPVGSTGTIYWDAAVRLACGNEGLTEVPTPKKVNRHIVIIRKNGDKPTPSCASGQTGTYPHCTEVKHRGQDGGSSGQNGNAGTDEYVPPENAGQPPAVYTPPAPPAPPVVVTPVAPVPETRAPKPETPATGVSCPPGLHDNGHGVCTT